MMFNSPPGLSDAMDLAKMLAVLDLIAPLADGTQVFRIWRQTRTGLLSYPLDIDAARAHLAASVYLQMALQPHIVHIVGHTEADHAATPQDVIESSKLARRAIENALSGQPDMTLGAQVQQRRSNLVREAQYTLEAIRSLAAGGVEDPLADAATLAKAVQVGIMDAPQLKNNPYARGQVHTRLLDGACESVDWRGSKITEEERLQELF